MPDVSVIIPVYKVEKYLEKCVDSVRRQTFKDLEILLIDDGSPDRCGKICDEFAEKDSRIKVIHQENQGLSAARNVGIDLSTGEYLSFVDSDDWLDIDMIELLMRLSQKYEADITECSYRNIYPDSIMEETKCSGEIVIGNSLTALKGMLEWKFFKPIVPNKLYRRGVFNNTRFQVGKIHEDEFIMHLLYLNAEKIIYADISKYNYNRCGTDSITGRSFHAANLDACEAFSKRMHLVWERNLYEIEELMNNNYAYVVMDRLEKCFDTKLRDPRVRETIQMALKDYHQIVEESRPLQRFYRNCFDGLIINLKTSMKTWKSAK